MLLGRPNPLKCPCFRQRWQSSLWQKGLVWTSSSGPACWVTWVWGWERFFASLVCCWVAVCDSLLCIGCGKHCRHHCNFHWQTLHRMSSPACWPAAVRAEGPPAWCATGQLCWLRPPQAADCPGVAAGRAGGADQWVHSSCSRWWRKQSPQHLPSECTYSTVHCSSSHSHGPERERWWQGELWVPKRALAWLHREFKRALDSNARSQTINKLYPHTLQLSWQYVDPAAQSWNK